MNEKRTISIDVKHDTILNKLAKANSVSKKKFICESIAYFEKYGISPITHESPSQEMQKLIKRVDQVIGFIRQNEKDILRPTCEALFSTNERIKLQLDSLVTKQDIKPISERFQFLISGQKDCQSLLSQTKVAQEQGFKLLARLIDAKEKTGVFLDITKAYNQK
ncbi:BfmA/BtgA family mobilization protein [Dysgonomonas sp. ZJ279]|uniref:BfmA/BtgA family mobilization protein n=1 Tax=Dysgonomonas sp. ZJ279 TaxID=2709796 RepID=UPI0013E9AA52|nr:BfmA/BtgA family mobilization protein [Dysgonomonas sp. ZJ279]